MPRYALVIGIAEYTGSFKSLETPVHNANAIADILDRHGDFAQVKRLPFQREAGQKDLGKVVRKPLPYKILVRELQQFMQEHAGHDVLIFYSGHGFTKLGPASRIGYLAPSDCQVDLDDAGQVFAEKNGYSLFDLNELIKQYTFSSLVVILDCCNAGAFLESDMVRQTSTAFGYQRDYYLITACGASSKAYEGQKYSLFTEAVLKGLSPSNAAPGSGRISGDRLFDVIGNELRNARQEPIRMGWGRMITLVEYPQPQENSEPTISSFNATNPYMGLKSFEREQADYFFGREQAVRALLDRLAENRFLAVIGPSGSGKSSLVKAGLLPELEADRIPGSREWHVEIIRHLQYPIQTLTTILNQPSLKNKPLLLFIDQFEELFTLCPHEEEQRNFIKRLHEETNTLDQQTRIIIAMRGDFLDQCAKFQEAADLINDKAPTTYMVTPLTEAKLVAELEESITCPALRHGVQFEEGLLSRIIDDVVNQPGAMPLLQYTLTQIWDSCISPDSSARLLTMQSYQAIEGVNGALQQWADQFYSALSSDDQVFVQQLVSELVQIGDGGEVTRRRASWERLRQIAASQEQLDFIMGRLIHQRLLVADEKTVEVAHEALLSQSKLIQGWIEENRDSIRLQQRLEIYRREWEERDRSDDYLLDAGRLVAIEDWLTKKAPRLTNSDQVFIGKSQEKRDRQIQAALEQERKLRAAAEAKAEAEADKVQESVARLKAEKQRTRIAIVFGIALTLTTIAAGISAFRAESEKLRAENSELNTILAQPKAVINTDNQLKALLEVVKALKQLQTRRNQPPDELKKIISEVYESNRLEGKSTSINNVDISSSGELIVSAGTDRVIEIWRNNGQSIQSFTNLGKSVWGIRFSHNNQIIASGSYDGIIRLWNLKGQLIKEIRPKILTATDVVLDVKFSPNDQIIASANWDKTVKLWEVKSGKLLRVRNHSEPVYKVSFSPDGKTIASASWDKTIKIWRVADGQLIRTLPHSKRVEVVDFSPNGQLLASGGQDQTIKIWRVSDGALIQEFLSGPGVYSLSFSPDGQIIASGGEDKTVKLWRVADRALLRTLRGHQNPVTSVRFNPDGTKLASTSEERTVRIWNLKPIQVDDADISTLLMRSCIWLKDYLTTNVQVSSEDKKICEGF